MTADKLKSTEWFTRSGKLVRGQDHTTNK